MTPEEWYTPETASAPAAAVAPAAGAAAFELRPLTLGEILDRTFAVYRSRFWLFVGIASLSAVVHLLMGVVQVFVQHRMGPADPSGAASAVFNRTGKIYALSFGLGIFSFLASALTQAGTVSALGEVYLGRATTIAASMRTAFAHWLRYIAIAIWQWWSFVWVGVVLLIPAIMLFATGVTGLAVLGGLLIAVATFGGIAAGVVMYLRNSLAVAASVMEGLPVVAAMRRSKYLAVGTKGRIFVVLLISLVLYTVVGMLETPLAFLMVAAAMQHKEAIGSQIAILLISFLGYAVVGPVAMIGLSLVYFDQRVRKEAFDLMVLLGDEPPAAPVVESAVAMEAIYTNEVAAVEEPEAAPGAIEPAAVVTETTTDEDASRPDDATGL